MNWLKQASQPLFPDVLWSRPENKRFAGKLLVIGGNSHGFSAVGSAYSAAEKAGVGSVRVILPDALEKVLRKTFPEAEFAASTPSGSFARLALSGLLDWSEWADAVLLAGDFGKNSETAILLEGFIAKYKGQVTLAGDACDYFSANPQSLTGREKTLLVADISRLQKLAAPSAALKQNAALAQVAEQLSQWTADNKLAVVTEHSGQLIAAYGGKTSSTSSKKPLGPEAAAYASVWLLQQPEKAFEALTTALHCYREEVS
jgi:ADP-dependent NAD(P)H-hydrate dehydratase / NAD(P)H-hydrate epimerase